MNSYLDITATDADKSGDAERIPPDETYHLPAVLDMKASRQLKTALKSFLDSPRRLVVDGGDVERMSTACIQVLVAFFAAAQRQSMPAMLAQPSRVFSKAIEDLGLSGIMEQWNLEK